MPAAVVAMAERVARVPERRWPRRARRHPPPRIAGSAPPLKTIHRWSAQAAIGACSMAVHCAANTAGARIPSELCGRRQL